MKVRYYGHVGLGSGYAVAAEHTCKALLSVGVDLEIVPDLKGRSSINDRSEHLRNVGLYAHLKHEHELDPNPDAVIVHTLPESCLEVARRSMGSGPWIQRLGRKWIAYTTWEGATQIPEHLDHELSNFDHVWFPSSRTVADAGMSPGLARVVPHAYDDSREHLAASTRRLDATGAAWRPAFTFYYVGAWSGRKNPAGILRAYTWAFRETHNVNLVMVCPGVDNTQLFTEIAKSGLEQTQVPPVQLLSDRLDDATLANLHRNADCFVTATRGESWNLPAFDAMLAGRHIITPAGLGSDDYLLGPYPWVPSPPSRPSSRARRRIRSLGMAWRRDPWSSSSFVRSHRVPAQVDIAVTGAAGGKLEMRAVGAHGLTSHSLWREPDMVELGNSMLAAYATTTRTLTLKYDPAERFGYAAVGKHILETLERP